MIVLVTDPRYPFDHLVANIDLVRQVLSADRVVVQYRDKSSPAADRARAIETLVAKRLRVVVNGTPEEARDFGAYGVHLPGVSPDVAHARKVLGDDKWVSIAAHDDSAVELAARERASAVLVSPIFDVPEKGAARGVDALRRARAIDRRLLVIALGGIDSLRRAASCKAAGADGIALIRAIFDAPDPARAALELTRPFVLRRP